MKSSTPQASYIRSAFRPAGRKFMMAFAFASLISGLSISTALADRDDGHGRADQRDARNQRGQHADRHDNRNRAQYRRSYNYDYGQPVYVPPPVYYEPQQSPGINLFFPFDRR